jgi:hypothetical protein
MRRQESVRRDAGVVLPLRRRERLDAIPLHPGARPSIHIEVD